MRGILGEKVGMTAVFAEDGLQVPVTVIRTTGNRVIDKRTEARNGYNAVVLGFGEKRVKRATKPEVGVFQPGESSEEEEGATRPNLVEERDGRQYIKRYLREFRVSADQLDGYEIGGEVAISNEFAAGDTVDVVGTSKGRGFTGVMKRYNFRGTKGSHGVHEYFRHGGAIGCNTSPARVFKNKKMPGQHGNKRVTVQNLKIVEVLEEEGLVLVRGGVPGPNGGLVRIQRAAKGRRH